MEKKQSTPLASTNQPHETHGPIHRQLTTDLVTRKKSTKEKLKIAFRSKLLELCKTGTKNSIPEMFNFYTDLAGQDKVTDARRATTCRRKFINTNKNYKKEGPPEIMGFNGETV